MKRAVVLAALTIVATSANASAFCRSTTCTSDCAMDDHGCKTTGLPLAWPTGCAGFSVQSDGTRDLPMDDVRGAIVKSFFTWTSVPCASGGGAAMALAELPDATCHAAEFDASGPNANIVLFQDDRWTFDGIDDNIAKTTVSFDVSTGVIQDADIQINSAYNDLTVGDGDVVYDLQSVLTHEVGHFLGLDHSDDENATMFAEYDPGTTSDRTLYADDVAAICAAYPPNPEARCDPNPMGGFHAECASDDVSSGCSTSSLPSRHRALGLVAIAGALLFARRRRR